MSTSVLGHRTRLGLGIAALLGVIDIVTAFFPTPAGEVGPPVEILVLSGLLGVVTVAAVAAVVAAARARRALRPGPVWIVVASRVISAATAVPAFFVVDVPTALKLVVVAFVVVTIVAVALLLAPARRSTPAVSDAW